ncbi:MAG TPA: formyl transferase, partial [Thermoanaerobaculia bacterium]
VAGQIAFMLLVEPWLRARGRERIAEIERTHGLDESPIAEPVLHVASVNSDEARAAIRAARPAVVVVNGTRIIGRATLAAIECPIINTHAGITPQYRGVHGAYWALAEGRPDLVGTTVHFVDPGIDTGAVIAQRTFEPTPADSFATYPSLHTAAGLPLLIDAVRDALRGELKAAPPRADLESRLRHHPTLWGYLYRRLRSAVR